MRTKHFIVGANEEPDKRQTRTDAYRPKGDLESSIRQLIKQRSGKCLHCEKCGSRNLEYLGLGRYNCIECKNIVLNNYGKVRECVDTYGSVSVVEVMDKTGLTKEDIRELEREGSVRLNVNGKIKLI